MPNWVYSNLTITDPTGTHEDRITSLVEQVGATYSIKKSFWDVETKTTKHAIFEETDPFSFWNIDHPEGEDLVRYEESIGASGAPFFWYDWNNNNWGTKWDAGEASMNQVSPTEVRYFFETAWSPPIPVIATLSAQYPDLHIELQWEEEQGFGGTFVFTNGEAEETDSYDIPNSHADHVARDKNCPCEDWGPEDSFPDCPSRVENAEGMSSFSEDELEIEVMS
jgi:hypothetical protein